MKRSMSHEDMRKYVPAFADGELDVEQNLMVLEHMANNPQSTRRAMHQQQLRQAVQRTMTAQAPAPSPELRRRIEQIVHETPLAAIGDGAGRRPRRGGWLRWAPTALAAMLLVAALALWAQSDGRAVPTAEPAILPVAVQQRFAHRHVDCSRMLEQLHNAERFPRQLEALSASLTSYLQVAPGSLPGLDLRSVGYEFDGAGECKIPGKRTVHMIYRPVASSGRADALSLWITPYEGEPAIEPGRVYTVSGTGSTHPLVVWRNGSMVYYLVGDSAPAVQAAASTLQQHGA